MGQVLDVMGPEGRVALKVANTDLDARQLQHEDAILHEVDHPHIPTSHGLETHGGVIRLSLIHISEPTRPD